MFGGQCHHHQHQKKTNSQTSSSWWFQPPLKIWVKMDLFSLLGVKIKNIMNCHPPSFFFNVDRFDAKLICMQPKSLEINFSMGFHSIGWELSTRISPLLPSYLRQLHWGDYWAPGGRQPHKDIPTVRGLRLDGEKNKTRILVQNSGIFGKDIGEIVPYTTTIWFTSISIAPISFL